MMSLYKASTKSVISGVEPEVIFLILVVALRPDHLGAYGYERPTTPEMDVLAIEDFILYKEDQPDFSDDSDWQKEYELD